MILHHRAGPTDCQRPASARAGHRSRRGSALNELLGYLTVLVAAAIPWLEVLLVVPAGIVAGLPPVPTAIVGAVGNTLTLVPLVLAGDRLRARWQRRRARRRETGDGQEAGDERRGARARRLFDRYGLVGMALLGPLVTGIHVAAVAALAAGAERRRTVVWLTGGVVVWSGIAAVATVVGIDAIVDPSALPDLFGSRS